LLIVESLRVHMRYNQKRLLSVGRECLGWTLTLLHVYPGPTRETWQLRTSITVGSLAT